MKRINFKVTSNIKSSMAWGHSDLQKKIRYNADSFKLCKGGSTIKLKRHSVKVY